MLLLYGVKGVIGYAVERSKFLKTALQVRTLQVGAAQPRMKSAS